MKPHKHPTRTLAQILKDQYNPQQKLLNLQNLPDFWKTVMQITDPDWTQLVSLFIENCQVRDLTILVKPWPNLVELYLNKNPIGTTGVKLLTKCQMPELFSLNLSRCQLVSQSVHFLVKGKWKHLVNLYLRDNKVGKGALDLVQANWPVIRDIATSQQQDMIFLMALVMIQSSKGQLLVSPFNQVMAENIRQIYTSRQN